MDPIFSTYDAGNYSIFDGIPYIKEGTVNTPPNRQLLSSDVGNITEVTFKYDDLGIENGSTHRTWTVEEMTIARLPQFCNDPKLINRSDTNSNDRIDIFTAPCDGIFRLATYNSGTYINGNQINYPVNTYDNIDQSYPMFLLKNDIVSTRGRYYFYIFLPYEYPVM